MTTAPRRILPTIIVALLATASLWFASNAVLPDLERDGVLPDGSVGAVTVAVQLGFITGTLVFSFLSISDRYKPGNIFLVCALLGAALNAAPLAAGASLWTLLPLRFGVGFFLAGIYPVGMKIAAGWYDRDLGKALGYLVGALCIGTALPHLIRAMGQGAPWETVLLAVSLIALVGGAAMIALVPDGPHLRSGARFDPAAFAAIFSSRDFRASSFGYFGHMWELYAFWAFVPAFLSAYGETPQGAAQLGAPLAVSFWSFMVIAAGAVGCVIGGLVSLRFGSARVAFVQLVASGVCCAVSPLAFFGLPLPAFLAFLLFWGVVVAGDSPQFSALNARYAPPDRVGSALTIVNCVGFAITALAIHVLGMAIGWIGAPYLFLLLAPGPVAGLLALRRLA